MTTDNYLQQQAYRKRLLPIAQRQPKLLTQVSQHYYRREMDKQTAAELAACFAGVYPLSASDIMHAYKKYAEFAPDPSIGNYTRQLVYHVLRLSGHHCDDWAEKLESDRLLFHTLYVAGFLAEISC